MKNLAILGSTGSIGQSTLKIARHLKDRITIKALAAKKNIDLLEQQAREFHPELIAVYDEDQAKILRKRLPNIPIESGLAGLNAVASCTSANFVMSAMTGTIGLVPTVNAIKAGKTIGLANKEALVSGGALVMSLAKKHGVKILPVDSEHSALFQCLEGQHRAGVRRLILTASGGPFRNMTMDQLKQVSLEDSLKHPTWQMGAKVTIDCSTLMNKGLEVIEAHWLFDVPIENISVIVHPQSIIHSMVEFVDSGLMAQMGESSMLTPIQYALTYPERKPGLLEPFSFTKFPTLQFFEPDTKKFPCLNLAFEAAKAGGTLPCYMNAANEVLVNQFMEKKISWFDISVHLDRLMNKHKTSPIHTLEDVLHADATARQEAMCILD